jgi:hypothetical protein
MGYRECRPICLFGKIVYERAYYYCPHCKSGWFPTDVEFGIEAHQTAGVREVISMLGVLEPFGPSAARILPRLTGLNVSASTVQRTTESARANVARRRDDGDAMTARRLVRTKRGSGMSMRSVAAWLTSGWTPRALGSKARKAKSWSAACRGWRWCSIRSPPE